MYRISNRSRHLVGASPDEAKQRETSSSNWRKYLTRQRIRILCWLARIQKCLSLVPVWGYRSGGKTRLQLCSPLLSDSSWRSKNAWENVYYKVLIWRDRYSGCTVWPSERIFAAHWSPPLREPTMNWWMILEVSESVKHSNVGGWHSREDLLSHKIK